MAAFVSGTLACATKPVPQSATPAESVGSVPVPDISCMPSVIDRRASDALLRVLQPGDRVLAVDNRSRDLVAVHVQNGTERWTLWLQQHDGQWNAVEKPDESR